MSNSSVLAVLRIFGKRFYLRMQHLESEGAAKFCGVEAWIGLLQQRSN